MSHPLKPEDVLALAPVIPVITIDDAAWAAPLARALFAGGMSTAEITLRTPAAFEAIQIMTREAPELVVGAGTILNESDLLKAAAAGAHYAISPGATPALLKAGQSGPIPLVPGVATASEIMLALEHGYRCLKFYPAEQLGGVGALKALSGPLPNVMFCPSGSIPVEKVADYLALKNVACVGGSWVATQQKMRDGDWAGVEALARQAAAFRR